ncbi:MAG: indolepyruvate ferredoxin oxidoreductase subunit alpha [Clostridiales Family XIII bacterium]|jgi:indolepyruvate ferredoxin oxidoreductase alpha subunit|nr:indolepyruvate ferredoxin oxidoreductase subunit alpha [Clostridiales Family XIII bacterium]
MKTGKKLMTGNEAVARGAYEAGLRFASAYPGTPSTEILENLVQYKDSLYCEWAPNEKVAVEAAIGASMAGVRSMAAMKHVGLNVAADPLFTFAYTGVTGGCVIVSADDPGMHSSQNEQDNRHYAEAAKVMMLEPSDSQEAKDFMKLGLALSEKFDTPVLLRMTTRVCHSKGLVALEDPVYVPVVEYAKKTEKYVAIPANARKLREKLSRRIDAMTKYSNKAEINVAEYNSPETGVVSSGVAYQYAREVFGEGASYLKLGLTWPLPVELIEVFASKVKKLYVVEELDPYLENRLKMAGVKCTGKKVMPEWGELNTDVVRKAVFGTEAENINFEARAVPRPPALCAGCPHRGLFVVLSKMKNLIITGDIGCYTLAAAPPLSAMDSCFCMGGSISTGHGAAKALKQAGIKRKVVSVIGDSTFFHSGVGSLMDVIYNKGNSVSVILDNRITAMTGRQENPGTGFTLMGDRTREVDIAALCAALGIRREDLYTVNPLRLDDVRSALEDALKKDRPTVIITRWPCVLKKFAEEDAKEFDLKGKARAVDEKKCRMCGICGKIGCPAIHTSDRVKIDRESCTGCAVCEQVCPFSAIGEVTE